MAEANESRSPNPPFPFCKLLILLVAALATFVWFASLCYLMLLRITPDSIRRGDRLRRQRNRCISRVRGSSPINDHRIPNAFSMADPFE